MNWVDQGKALIARPLARAGLWYLSVSSDQSLATLAYLAEKLDPVESHRHALRVFRRMLEEGHPARCLAQRVLRDVNPRYRDFFANNFLVNAASVGVVRRKLAEREGVKSPFVILISPTMRCNLRCEGCYAGNYSKKDDLEFEVIDKVIREGKEMGVYFYTILGGEPFLRNDLFKIYKKHDNAAFQVFTNGFLLDEKKARRVAELGNVAVIVSLEGFEEETDLRRGSGAFMRAMTAMDNLHKAGVLFGTSVVPTRKNLDVVSSDQFIDMLIGKGAFIVWYFLYMPIGLKPDTSLMPTPAQRNKLRERIKQLRKTKDIVMIDFWGDAPLVNGCIAGREYVHINSRGDVEPCIFVHFAKDNIREKSLKEAFNSPFMESIRRRQPYSHNLLMPCMLIDNPHVIREVYSESTPRPTHEGAETLITNLKTDLDNYAQNVKEVYTSVWQKEYAPRYESSQTPSSSP